MTIAAADFAGRLAGAVWQKSSRSGTGNNDACVEVAFVDPAVAVRDSKRPNGGALVLGDASWRSFLNTVRR